MIEVGRVLPYPHILPRLLCECNTQWELVRGSKNVPWTEIPVIGSMQEVFLVPPSIPKRIRETRVKWF